MKPKLSWLIAPISLGAFVATWGGWARLATMTGYGPTELWPGSGLLINTGVVLPLTVEPFGMLAMAMAFNPKLRTWARVIAGVMAAITLVAAGICQVVVHQLTVQGATVAPQGIVAITSVLPVIALGLSGALAMLNNNVRVGTAGTPDGTGVMSRLGQALGQAAVSRAERFAASQEVSREPVQPVAQAAVPAIVDQPTEVVQPVIEPVAQVSQADVPAGQGDEERWTRLDQVERLEAVRDILRDDPEASQRTIAARLGTTKSTVGRLMPQAKKAVQFYDAVHMDRPIDPAGTADGTHINGNKPNLEVVK